MTGLLLSLGVVGISDLLIVQGAACHANSCDADFGLTTEASRQNWIVRLKYVCDEIYQAGLWCLRHEAYKV
jgi:hypothetical protein